MESNHKDIALFYEGIVEMVSHSEVGVDQTLAVLSKVLILLSMSTGRSKEDFLTAMDRVWEFENFFQPDAKEKH